MNDRPQDEAVELRRRPRRWLDRGTVRNPGPHLDRMPVAFDLAGISLAEGVRAAIASGVVLLGSVWLNSFPLLIAAFAANLTCFCDSGGPLAGRVRALLTFTFLGATCWVGFGLLRNLDWPWIVPFAGLGIFLCSMARVWGAAAQAVGNVLIVTVALALDTPLSLSSAGVIGGSFIAGGLWSVVLTLVIWRIHPAGAAIDAVELAWTSLAAMAADLRRIALDATSDADWEEHARAHRRATRVAIEEARIHVSGAVHARGPTSVVIRRTMIRLEAAESVFAALIALSDVLEAASPQVRTRAALALRTLRPLLSLCGKGAFGAAERFEMALSRVEEIAESEPAIASLFHVTVEALRITARAATAEPAAAVVPARVGSVLSLGPALLVPLRDNLTWGSAILRHALRATVLTIPALAWALIWWTPYSHWLTITVALTMQPYFAATWQRVLERVGGTLLGGLIGAGVAFMPDAPFMKAVLLVPLCVIGFSVRQVSYGAYIACLTPLVVVFFDVAVPGHSDATIALMRLTYTAAGGLLAVAGCVVLWPSWEPDRLLQEIANALRSHARFAEAVFDRLSGQGTSEAVQQARRGAGVANNNLEASLSRSLQEPIGRSDGQIEAGLVIDAAMRRLGAVLVTLQHEELAAGAEQGGLLPAWRGWVVQALDALADGHSIGVPAPEAPSSSTFARLRRAIDVIANARTGRPALDRALVSPSPRNR